MMNARTLKTTAVSRWTPLSTGEPAGPTALSAMPKITARKMICRISPSTNGPKTLSGTIRSRIPPMRVLTRLDQGSHIPRRLERARVGVHAVAQAQQVDGDQAGGQGDDGADLEVGQRLQAGQSDLLQVRDAGDAADNGEEHDGADQHLHQGDEGGSDGLHRHPDVGPDCSDDDAEDDRDQDLDVELAIPPRFRGGGSVRCRAGVHGGGTSRSVWSG